MWKQGEVALLINKKLKALIRYIQVYRGSNVKPEHF